MSQSAASAAIKALEHGSGVQLFNRVGRAIELSPAGRRFLPEAKAVLERIAAARHVLENASQTIAGSIAIAASQTIASYWLPRRLAAFQEEHPAVRLGCQHRQHAAGREQGARRHGGSGAGRGPHGIRHTSPHQGRCRPPDAGRGENPSRGRRTVSRPAGYFKPALDRPRGGSGTREVLQDLARRMGIPFDSLSIFLVLPSNEAIVQAVEAGAGATIISELVVGRAVAEGSLRHVPLDAAGARFRRHLASRPSADAVPDCSEVVSCSTTRVPRVDRVPSESARDN